MQESGSGAGRGPARDPAARPASDPAIVAEMRAEITAGGPLTFDRFMELALYHPLHGYYLATAERATRAGDFLSAPEMDPIFGRTLAHPVAETWRLLGEPDPFTVVEYGAGSGALAAALVEGLRRHAPRALAALRYAPIELNEHRLRELRRRFEVADVADHLVDPAELDAQPATGMVLANEFLDAMPVHRLVVVGGRLRERYVDWEDPARERAGGRPEAADPASGLVERLGPPSDPRLAARLMDEAVDLAEGQQAEVCLAIDPWFAEVDRRLAAGLVLVVDYGHPAHELFAPDRAAGTIMAYSGHRAGEEVLRAVGRQDLTAHVDLTAVQRSAATHGFRDLGLERLQAFLVAAGLGSELTALQEDPRASLGAYASARAAIGRLLDPRLLGGFAVLGFGRSLPPETSLGSLVRARQPFSPRPEPASTDPRTSARGGRPC